MTREKMLDEMIRIYGFEHEEVIKFAHAMESPYISDHALELILKLHRLFPVGIDEDEDE